MMSIQVVAAQENNKSEYFLTANPQMENLAKVIEEKRKSEKKIQTVHFLHLKLFMKITGC